MANVGDGFKIHFKMILTLKQEKQKKKIQN